MKLLTKLGFFALPLLFSVSMHAKEAQLQVNADNIAHATAIMEQIKEIRNGNDKFDPNGREYTHLLWEAGKYKDILSENDAQFLSSIQAAPEGFQDYYKSESGAFRVWFKWDGTDAVDETDENGNEVPDVVEDYARWFDNAREKYVEFGMLMPYSRSTNKDLYDVYIADSYCQSSVLGYTSPNVTYEGQMIVPSYIVVREDYSPFAYNKPAGYTDSSAAQITIAHEFFHACQMMISYANMNMFTLEGGAVWAEQFVYPTDTDPCNYISGFTSNASLGLNFNPRAEYNPGDNQGTNYVFPYGTWVYFNYLTSMYGNEILKELYDALYEETEIKAYNTTLKKYGTSFSETAKNMYMSLPMFPNDPEQKPYYFVNGDQIREHNNNREYSFTFPASTSELQYTTQGNTPRTFESANFPNIKQRLNRLAAHYYRLNTDRGATLTITPLKVRDSLSVIVLQYANYRNTPSNANKFKFTSVDAFGTTPVEMHFDYDPELTNMYIIVYNNGVRYTVSNTDYLYSTNTAYYTLNYQPDENSSSVEDEYTTQDFSIRNITPMPANENSTLNLLVAKPAMLNYTVYNMQGQKIISDSFFAQIGENAQNLDLNGLNAGAYLIEVNNGVKSEKINFIVK